MSVSLAAVRPRAATASLVALGLAIGALILLFLPECRAAVRVWIDSTAYGHCFLVLPIALFLAWDRRAELRGLTPEPTAAFAWLALPLALAWLTAERLAIMEGRQLVALATLELLFLTMLGPRLFRALLGPLLYLVFLVPFGAFLTNALQVFTANFVNIGLTIVGIPHFVTDMTIEIAGGTFFVAEACAGLRFLIASVAFGVFFALLNYRSPGRRTAFIAASIVVPIVANGFRALGIVVLGQVLGSAEAAVADHIIYGWAFFSFVTVLLVLAGLPFREAPPAAPPSAASMATGSRQSWAALLVLGLAALGPAAALALDSRSAPARLTAQPSLKAPAGCSLTPSAPAAPDRAVFRLACPSHVWTVTLQAVPASSTGAALADAKARLIGPLDSDEAVTATLAPGWQSIVSRDPPEIIAVATWIDGQWPVGGLAQRIRQAKSSVTTPAFAPLVIVVASTPPASKPQGSRPIPSAEAKAMLDDLSRFIAAQPDLTAEVARITATAPPASSSPRPLP